ncbi:glycine/betaine ABC transporter [Halorhodospira abdelmalekii]|uniref:BCCT family transporter n=1 Tax=Halorhodospira abdelmalekii TaxID=421629 RepID=UPI001908DBEA|nr:BCCT family transporter [Halorhodospira abdelmalekii]MBK1733811.1 glycine/betaine ABC transporter [Halorhodospira abdelmalekii]
MTNDREPREEAPESLSPQEVKKEIKELEKEYDTDHEIGEQNIRPLGLDLHNPVFVTSAGLILAFLIGTLIFTDVANDALGAARAWSTSTFDWFFLGAGNLFVLFCLALIVLPVGKIRLGGVDATPDFSRLSWFAMLFAAGMGIGLMFWAVAEPVAYYTDWFGTPLNVEGNTPEAAYAAMGATMYHWGLHPWAIYGVMALALAFFSFNKGLPLTVRSVFYPLLGERVWGPIGHVIDTVAVLATIFGLATSLGFGAQQAASGLSYVFEAVPDTLATQVAIIIGVTVAALISVLRGIDGGIKVLSNLNIGLAGLLMLFVIITGGAIAFAVSLATTSGAYVSSFLSLSNPIGREDETFLHGWTAFYWAWWISWSPFVGMFIARVSRGRTVREFMTAVLIVPTLVTIVWMSAFGGTGLQQAVDGVGELAAGLGADESMALFHMLEQLPWTTLTALLAVFLVLVFFVTSSDSGSLVIDSITAGGKLDSPDAQRVFWVTLEGLLAGTLLFIGGDAALSALQAGAVTTGLPFTVVLVLICVSLFMGLQHERKLLKLSGKI